MAGRPPTKAAQNLILDTGALIALSRGNHRIRAIIARALDAGSAVAIPSVSITETVRGGPKDAAVNRVITAVGRVVVTDESRARRAGALLGAAKSSAAIDAIVVATAEHLGPAIVATGDRKDIGRLAGHAKGVAVLSI